MAHKWWEAWSLAYAEGNLPWPLVKLLQRHCRACQHCQQLVSSEMAFISELDASLLNSRRELVHTIAGFTQKQVERKAQHTTRLPLKTLVAVAATLLLVIGGWQLSVLWSTPSVGNAIYASSSSGTNADDHSGESAKSGFVFYSDSNGTS